MAWKRRSTHRAVLQRAEAAGANAEPEDALSVVSITAWRTINLGRSPSAMAGARRMSAVQTDHSSITKEPKSLALSVCSGRQDAQTQSAHRAAGVGAMAHTRLRSAAMYWPALST